MLFSQLVYRIAARTPRNSLPSCRWILSHRRYGHQPTFRNSNENKKHLDPFSLVGDELSLISMRLRSMVVAEVPELASAAGYFFKEGVEGKKLCPTVILLMATALNVCTPELSPNVLGNTLILDLRRRQQCIAEITEMIHVASLIHDDVLDDADTRRGIGSLSSVMGNKLAILAGDLLISRALVALASLKHTEVVSLMATALKNLVSGETMQMTATFEQRCSLILHQGCCTCRKVVIMESSTMGTRRSTGGDLEGCDSAIVWLEPVIVKWLDGLKEEDALLSLESCG